MGIYGIMSQREIAERLSKFYGLRVTYHPATTCDYRFYVYSPTGVCVRNDLVIQEKDQLRFHYSIAGAFMNVEPSTVVVDPVDHEASRVAEEIIAENS